MEIKPKNEQEDNWNEGLYMEEEEMAKNKFKKGDYVVWTTKDNEEVYGTVNSISTKGELNLKLDKERNGRKRTAVSPNKCVLTTTSAKKNVGTKKKNKKCVKERVKRFLLPVISEENDGTLDVVKFSKSELIQLLARLDKEGANQIGVELKEE